ncbi:MAG: SUMF1/EgtB/PvdO family nonheme iron enzyme [Bacteroidetes bacterium]|nr:SUMF1/EgtB/PvdO family nonheme iron enzyme [Bacteroidota bacterium]
MKYMRWCLFCLLTFAGMARAQFPVRMVSVQAGEFMMGDVQGTGEREENPVRRVKLDGFYMQTTEVTFAQFDRFYDETWYHRPEDYNWGRGDTLPVMGVSWYDAVLYCNWLSEKEGFQPCYVIDKLRSDSRNLALMDIDKWTVTCNWQANGYRLPTEAEWEYAARGGHLGRPYPGAGGTHIDSIAWYARNAEYRIRNVAVKQPNSLGIYDLTGNVAEWCWDWHAPTYDPSQTHNPTGPDGGRARVVRGGSWMDEPQHMRITYRSGRSPVERHMRHVGFRVVRRM